MNGEVDARFYLLFMMVDTGRSSLDYCNQLHGCDNAVSPAASHECELVQIAGHAEYFECDKQVMPKTAAGNIAVPTGGFSLNVPSCLRPLSDQS